jgi:hypothetical protein
MQVREASKLPLLWPRLGTPGCDRIRALQSRSRKPINQFEPNEASSPYISLRRPVTSVLTELLIDKGGPSLADRRYSRALDEADREINLKAC